MAGSRAATASGKWPLAEARAERRRGRVTKVRRESMAGGAGRFAMEIEDGLAAEADAGVVEAEVEVEAGVAVEIDPDVEPDAEV